MTKRPSLKAATAPDRAPMDTHQEKATAAGSRAEAFGQDVAARLAEAAAELKAPAKTGRLMLYLEPDLHREFKAFSARLGVSMNRAAIIAIQAMMDHHPRR